VRPQEFKEPEQLRKIERTLIKHRFMGSCTAANKAVVFHGVLQRGMEAATRGSLGWQHEVDADGKRVFKAPLPKGRGGASHPDAADSASSSSASSSVVGSRAPSPVTDRNGKKCARCQKMVLFTEYAKSQRTCKACQADPAAAGV
jgi:hypothetical protein